jgi:hypothetical protein
VRRLLLALAAAAAVVAVMGTVASAASGLPGEQKGAAPWGPGNGPNLTARLEAVGLPALPQEYFDLHIHQHLDVYVNGRHVTVPASIGINFAEQYISPLHTHDTSGVIHVESPRVQTFTLEQFFGVWGVRLTPRYLGGYRATKAKPLRVFLDGRAVKGDFRLLPLRAHEEIAIVYGQAPAHIPRSYAFPAGL